MQDNPIIDFEQLFQQPETPNSPRNIKGYVFSIFTYLFVMFIVTTFLFLAFREVSLFIKTVTPETTISELLYENENRIAIIPTNTLDVTRIVSNHDNYQFIEFDAYTWIIPLDASYVLEGVIDITLFNQENLDMQYVIIYVESTPFELINFDANDIAVSKDSYETFNNLGLSAMNFIIYVLLFIPIVIFLKSDLMFDFNQMKTFKQKIIGFIISGYIYVFLANFIASTLISLLQSLLNLESTLSVNQSVIQDMLLSEGLLFTFLSAVILGPIVEELVFRKALFGLIKHTKFALVLSSLLFGVIHVTSEASIETLLIQMIPYITLGFVFGYLYIKHEKNIMIPIIVHMLSNFISIILTLIVL